MTGLQSLEARTALGSCFAVVSYLTATSGWIHRAARKTFDRALNAAFVLSRLSLYITAFFILRLQVRGDLPTFYVLPARALFLHMMPYRDYGTSYAPVHPFFDAAILMIWNSPLAIILVSILAECFLLPVWMRAARRFVSERSVRIAAVLYLTSAASAVFVSIDGQDNVIIALLVGLGVLALGKYRAVLSGALVALGAVVFKFLPILFAPAFLVVPARKMRWLLGFVGTLILGYGYFAWIRLPLLYPVTFEHTDRTASDLPFVLECITGFTLPLWVGDLLVAIPLLAILYLLARIALRRPSLQVTLRTASFGSAALLISLLVFSRKSWPPYVMLVLFPLCLAVSRRPHLRLCVAGFAIFNVLAVTTHSIWATVFLQMLPEPFHPILMHGDPMAIVLAVTQTALLVGYVWLIFECVAELRLAAASPGTDSEPAAEQLTSS